MILNDLLTGSADSLTTTRMFCLRTRHEQDTPGTCSAFFEVNKLVTSSRRTALLTWLGEGLVTPHTVVTTEREPAG